MFRIFFASLTVSNLRAFRAEEPALRQSEPGTRSNSQRSGTCYRRKANALGIGPLPMVTSEHAQKLQGLYQHCVHFDPINTLYDLRFLLLR